MESEELESTSKPSQEADALNNIIEHVSPIKSGVISSEKQVGTLSELLSHDLAEERPALVPSVQQITVSPEQPTFLSPVKSDQSGPSLSKQQRLLFEQQLRQHVQLTTMHFLQCYKHPTLFELADEMKYLLVSASALHSILFIFQNLLFLVCF